MECIKRGEEIIFWIENETESIDEKEIPKLCDAFYRIDKSRNKRLVEAAWDYILQK